MEPWFLKKSTKCPLCKFDLSKANIKKKEVAVLIGEEMPKEMKEKHPNNLPTQYSGSIFSIFAKR